MHPGPRVVLALLLVSPALAGCLDEGGTDSVGRDDDNPYPRLDADVVRVWWHPPPERGGDPRAMQWPVRDVAIENDTVTLRAWPDGIEGPDFRLTLSFPVSADAPVTLTPRVGSGAPEDGEFTFTYEESIFWAGRPVNNVTRVHPGTHFTIHQWNSGTGTFDATFRLDFEATCAPAHTDCQAPEDGAHRVVLNGTFGGGAPDATPPGECRDEVAGDWNVTTCPATLEGVPGDSLAFKVSVRPANGATGPSGTALRASHWVRALGEDEEGFVAIPPEGRDVTLHVLPGMVDRAGFVLVDERRPDRLDGPAVTLVEEGVEEYPVDPIPEDADPPRGLHVREDANGTRVVTFRLDDPAAHCSLVVDPRGRAFLVDGAEGLELVLLVQWTMTDACGTNPPPSGVQLALPPDVRMVQGFRAADGCFCPPGHQPSGWHRVDRLSVDS